METDQLQAFNERLSQWISNQGFWFQLRYSMSGGGYSSATFHFLRLLFRLFLFMILAGVGGWIYLVKRVDAKTFPRKLEAAIGRNLEASEAKVDGFQRIQSKLNMRYLSCTGGSDSFYSGFKAWNIHCDMGLLDGVIGTWKPGPLTVDRMEMEIRAGSDDQEQAGRRSASFLKVFPKFDASSIEVSSATIRWGFLSDLTKGSIERSHLNAQRVEDGWRLQFHDGQFTQGLFRRIDIKRLVVVATSTGIKVEEAEFTVKPDDLNGPVGTLSMSGVTVGGGARPAVAGSAKLRHAPLETLMPERFQGFIEGSISTDFKLSGSTNSTDGVTFDGQVVLDGKDRITLRDRIPLLRALTNVGSAAKYRKVVFSEGSFVLRSSGGVLDIHDVNLKASEPSSELVVMTMQGSLKARPPTRAEIDAAVSRRSPSNISAIFDNSVFTEDIGKQPTSTNSGDGDKGEDLSLKKAAALSRADEDKQEKEDKTGQDPDVFARLGQGQVDARTQRIQEQGKEVVARTLRYEGALQITIPGDSFERADDLRPVYPADPVTGRILINVPLEGSLFDVTLKQAEDIYLKGRRHD